MKYQIQNSLTGKWLPKDKIKSGDICKIVSETKPQPSNFEDKDGNVKNQDVCKIRIVGHEESYNISLNRATLNGLVSAFGEDSVNWQNHDLVIEVEKMRVAGKAVLAVYLIPDGYEKVDDNDGYAMIIKKGLSSDEEYDAL